MAAITLLACAAQAFTLVGPGAQARVVVDRKLPDYVLRATQDLTNDVKKITGVDLPLMRPVRYVRGFRVLPGDLHVTVKPDGRWEAYSVREQGGVLEIVVLLFRRWAEPGAAEDDPAAPAGRFDATPATLEGDENLDVPTFLRRRINFDPD